MIVAQIQRGLFSYREKWFCAAPPASESVHLVHYRQSQNHSAVHGFRRTPFDTILIDLARSDTALFQACRKTNQNEIRRAEREGVEFVVEDNPGDFLAFYNRCAGLFAVAEERLKPYGQLLQMTEVAYEGKVLVAHAYLVDESIRRTRLLLSASAFGQAQNQKERQLIGRAHRLLIYREMLYFRDHGADCLDLGGCAPENQDRKLQDINTFKLGFGGGMARESDYVSYSLYFFRLLARKAKLSLNTRAQTFAKGES
jgi:lipid II:glycine glycyltransferase (peptidoglycan interpeptide bridge formation enzyme)